ncbi:LacI family DNA-binding transcriptional regulator [Bifidobacterium sp. ESL0732]|uniref:LacI family DNA-binding transcriptional regulator n=1 Tax=Bifidobacterium sp. ESL0732 TaxID=2983222 RepID=UPI0023F8C11D|nr:LacI family DNA-binding transcriptional regulator [Bifidobacterium sp. ESL0732]WEV64217.1 LacI family DNA-binding transcriptional regulator [Bifidobacterium sp. ESL0732]
MSNRTTLRDVAKATGVSITTVSLVLNNHPTRVSEEKRELIKRKASELNYVPNQTARSLVTKRSMLLALLVPDIENLFFASLAKEIEDECSTDGYSLIIANSNDSKNTERQLLQQFEARNIDGLFLIPSSESTKDSTDLRSEVAQMSCPVVLTDRLVREQWCDAAGSDNYQGGQLAARLFVEAGHTHIACISGRHDNGNAEARKAGFVDELGKNHITIDPQLDCYGAYRFDGGYQTADRILDSGATAVFCCNDLMALGFSKRAEERNLSIPEDISLIGYDNVLNSLGIASNLTTIDQDIPQLAKSCHAYMMNRIKQKASKLSPAPWLNDPQTSLLKPKMIIKGSVRTVK